MAARVYVALDLETTGLDANRDAIIEIGAVRFQGNRVLERFSTLVNPQRNIPLRIQQITGIRNADVADAPPLAAVTPELLAFVRGDVTALVAHNADFDLGFLRAAGIHFHRPALDTFELATILLPGAASYNLGELCRQLAIPLQDAHRAADDAEATAQLFAQLSARIATLPRPALALIEETTREVDWPPRFLFAEALADQPIHAASFVDTVAAWPTVGLPMPRPLPETPAPVQPIDPDVVEQIFAPHGPLAAQLGALYEPRPGQRMMAQQVLHALNEGDHLLIEAGTGTGKSLAYLLPAALWSVANQQRVLIATNTIALQDQLLNKDLPQLLALMAAERRPTPQVALLKGRANYLCTRRFHAWRTDHPLTPREASLAAKIIVWLTQTTTGDMSELLLASPADRATWAQLCSDPTLCSPQRCGERIRLDDFGLPAGDFFLHARARAEGAHILVVNHALLLADLAAGGRVLPPYAHLVVDEAHHLEDVASEQLTVRIDWRRLGQLLYRLTPEQNPLKGIMTEAQRRHWQECVNQLETVTAHVAHARAELQDFAGRLLAFTLGLDGVRRDMSYVQRVALDSRLRAQPLWSQLEVEWDNAGDPLRTLVRQLGALVGSLDEAGWRQTDATATLAADLDAIYGALKEATGQLDAILFEPQGADGLVKWLELAETGDTVAPASAPLYVNSVIETGLVHRRRSAIFTSATLRTGGGFEFVRERLGLWEVKTAMVESPFDYKTSTLLLLPANLPAPNHPDYQPAVAQAIIDAALAAQGRTLALFTSYAQLRTTADAIRAPLDRESITVLQHGVASRNRLLREFRQTERAVLLGTRSFWEGIDLPGDDLSCLLIVRLPFAVPSDPLVAARTADLEDAFNEFTLPDAVLRFRQGFGRLIRRATDRGVVIVLDSRVWQREYGRAFLDALPPCTTQRPPLSNVGEEVRTWLG